MKRSTAFYFVLFLILFFAFAALLALNINSAPVSISAAGGSLSGEEMYQVYCASCHGRDAKGSVTATDLTVLSRQHDGKFPMTLVKDAIRGDARVAAHGPKDMPVWGHVFRYMGSGSRLEVEVRINNLAEYIKTLQVK
jgi:mono/diheme cytochrome c family protein